MTTPCIWRQIQKENFTHLHQLLTFLRLPLTAESNDFASTHFPLNLPRRLAEKIQKGVWDDPILLQFLPAPEEKTRHPLFQLDPVGDRAALKQTKLLHKYQGRALLLCTSACAMHCRYCFRQYFEYETQEKGFSEELQYIAQDPSLSEILLSGGDPLSLSNDALETLLTSLSGIAHLKRIRFHTRFPIGIPERIDTPLLALLERCPKQVIVVVHCNHPAELDSDIFSSLKKIQRLGIPVLSQSVLLKGINDTVPTLKTLFLQLIDHGILPYYLHQLDRVQGSSHFEVSSEEGKAIMAQLAKELPGYALPRYVQEVAQLPHKLHLV